MSLIPRIAEPLIDDPVSDEELRQRVMLYLAACRQELGELTAIASSGTVALWGELPTFYLRQLAVERTRHVAGVRQLIDHIKVPELSNGLKRFPK